MKVLALVRLGTYGALLLILFAYRDRIGVIPVHLISPDAVSEIDQAPERRKWEGILVSSGGFRSTRLSGSEVVAIAEEEARRRSVRLEEFSSPEIKLLDAGGRLVWVVWYVAQLGPWQFEVTIDDQTRAAIFENTTAPI